MRVTPCVSLFTNMFRRIVEIEKCLRSQKTSKISKYIKTCEVLTQHYSDLYCIRSRRTPSISLLLWLSHSEIKTFFCWGNSGRDEVRPLVSTSCFLSDLWPTHGKTIADCLLHLLKNIHMFKLQFPFLWFSCKLSSCIHS